MGALCLLAFCGPLSSSIQTCLAGRAMQALSARGRLWPMASFLMAELHAAAAACYQTIFIIVASDQLQSAGLSLFLSFSRLHIDLSSPLIDFSKHCSVTTSQDVAHTFITKLLVVGGILSYQQFSRGSESKWELNLLIRKLLRVVS